MSEGGRETVGGGWRCNGGGGTDVEEVLKWCGCKVEVQTWKRHESGSGRKSVGERQKRCVYTKVVEVYTADVKEKRRRRRMT